MALYNAIRRAVSKVVPLTTRASAATRTPLRTSSSVSAPFISPSGNALQGWKGFASSQKRFYSPKMSSDESLLRVIETEIKCAIESQEDEAEEVPQGFPFKINDNPGQQTITLTREYEGEIVTAEVHMPDLVTGEENDNDDGDDEEGSRANQSSLPMVVTVSKKGGPYLEFGCTAFPDEISIDSLSVKEQHSNSEDQIAYEGPDFADLDENLQKAFHKYLEIRGIKPSTTNFLHAYMVDKDSREYVTWLNNLKKYVEA